MDKKLKFLLVRESDSAYGKENGINFSLMSSNLLLNQYEFFGRDNRFKIACSNQIGDMYSCTTLDRLFKEGDIEGLKDYIFGKEIAGLVDLSINEMYIGTRADGTRITAIYDYDCYLDFKTITVEGIDKEKGYDKLRLKLEMAGYRVACGFYNSGIVCDNLDDLKYIDKTKCIALSVQLDKIRLCAITFDSLYLQAKSMDNSRKIIINNLLNSIIFNITNSELQVVNAVSLITNKVLDSKIVIANIAHGDFNKVYGSYMEFTQSMHKVRFRQEIKDSEIRFNCDVDRNTLVVGMKLILCRVNLIFNRNVTLERLRCVIDRALNNYGNGSNQFKLVVNGNVYKGCMKKLDSKYLKYIKNGEEL